jgi:hypothetical protein
MGLLERYEIRRYFEGRFERLSPPVFIHVLRRILTDLRRSLRLSRAASYFIWAFPIFTDAGPANVSRSDMQSPLMVHPYSTYPALCPVEIIEELHRSCRIGSFVSTISQ